MVLGGPDQNLVKTRQTEDLRTTDPSAIGALGPYGPGKLFLYGDLKSDQHPQDFLEEEKEVAAKKKISAKKKATAKKKAGPKKSVAGKGRGVKSASFQEQAGVVYSDVRRQFRLQLLGRLR
jgi:hypothetical protein